MYTMNLTIQHKTKRKNIESNIATGTGAAHTTTYFVCNNILNYSATPKAKMS